VLSPDELNPEFNNDKNPYLFIIGCIFSFGSQFEKI
jgi:hypothetical protein